MYFVFGLTEPSRDLMQLETYFRKNKKSIIECFLSPQVLSNKSTELFMKAKYNHSNLTLYFRIVKNASNKLITIKQFIRD